MKRTTNNKAKGDLASIPMVSRRKITWDRWYEMITPFLGLKWGAEITLIGYGWLSGSDGLKVAAGIVTVFLFLEWCQMAWCEFKRRVAQ